jgi:hypothetical protein
LPPAQADEPVWRLLTERPGHLVPPGYPSWDAVIEGALENVQAAIDADAGGQLERFTWGAGNRAAIKHPLSPKLFRFVPLDPPDEPQSGDIYQPRVAAPGFGASERFVVAPGQEATGIFHMPRAKAAIRSRPTMGLGTKLGLGVSLRHFCRPDPMALGTKALNWAALTWRLVPGVGRRVRRRCRDDLPENGQSPGR